MSSNASALRDLIKINKIRSLHASKEEKQIENEEQQRKQMQSLQDLMRFVVSVLKSQPNHQIEIDVLSLKIQNMHNGKSIPDLCKMSSKQFFILMDEKQLITSTLTESKKRMIQIIDVDDCELNYRISGKAKDIISQQKWENKHYDDIIKLSKMTIKILQHVEKGMKIEKISRKIAKKLGGESLRQIFGKNKTDIWQYMQNKIKLIVIQTSFDGGISLIKLNTEFEWEDIKEPPCKKRRLNKHINDYNNGKINESKLTEKIVKKLNKLQSKHEIHFYFKLAKPSVDDDDDDLTDSN